MDISQLLLNAANQDPSIRVPADAQLKAIEAQNWPAYLTSLCTVLSNGQAQPLARQLAGLMLKNALVSKDEVTQNQLGQRWLTTVEENARKAIQQMLLMTLPDPLKEVRSTAALVIGKVAAVEIPQNQWQGLVEHLVASITNAQSSPFLQEASFQALGFVCEECHENLQDKSTLVLNAVARGMYSEQTNDAIKLAATQALTNSIYFVHSNFALDRDRGMIMTMVFQAAASSNVDVRVAAFNCLVEIASAYYNYMPEYMSHLFMMTGKAIQSWLNGQGESEAVVLQSIEFWSAICDVERGRQDEIDEEGPSKEFAKAALSNLAPLLLQCLTRQSEEVDDETWIPAMAAATCLDNFARTVHDDIVPVVLPWVEQNITNVNWRFREAATIAFGSILDGPDKSKLAPLVKNAFNFILGFMKDASPIVKDTAAWTIGRICDVLPETIDPVTLPLLMQQLHAGLDEEPKIASHVCWAIHNLADALVVDEDEDTSALSPFFEGIVSKLLTITMREDASDTNLIPSAYEAVNVLVSNAAPDVFPLIEKLIPTLLSRLQATLTAQGISAQDREHQNEIQGLLCGAIQSIITKEPKLAIPHSDSMMQLFLGVLTSKSATVHEEAMMAIGAVANAVPGATFARYMPHFKQFLVLGLGNFKEHQVCSVAVGVVGDICRSMEGDILPYCDEFMQLLLQNLQNPQVERTVKPQIISCIGDVAMAIGVAFERYLPFVMMLFVGASRMQFPEDQQNPDNLDYLNSLRSSLLEGYTSIIQSFADKSQVLQTFIPSVMAFLDLLSKESELIDDSVLQSAVGLIGDLASVCGRPMRPVLRVASVSSLLQLAAESPEKKTNDRATWAAELMHQL